MTQYLTPKQIWKELGIKPALIKYYRRKGYLTNFKKSPGSNDKGGRTFYNVNEIKKVFFSVS